MKRPVSLADRQIAAQARTLGVSADQLTNAVQAAYLVWRMRTPWRLLPRRLRRWVFLRFCGPFVNRFVAGWINGG